MPGDVTDPRAELRAAVNRLTPWERNFLVVVNRQGLDMAWPDMGCRSLADAQAKLDAIRAKLPTPAPQRATASPFDITELRAEAMERDAVIVVLTDDVDDLAHRVAALERIMDGETLGDVLDVPISAVVTALARIGRGEARSVVAAIGDEQARAGASS
jgi:hypothetical protein